MAASAALFVLNNSKATFEGTYNYNVSCFENGSYIDGSRFDVRDLVSLEKLEKYKSENPKLAKVNMEKAYYDGAIESIEQVITYRPNEKKVKDTDPDQVIDQSYFRIVLRKKALSFSQAQALTRAIANEANSVNKAIVENADNKLFLRLYDSADDFASQISYLESQYKLIIRKYDNLIANYGDLTLSDSSTLSGKLTEIKETFKDNELNVGGVFVNLNNELSANGYVKNYAVEKQTIENQKLVLQQEKKVNIDKKNELINQRDALLAATTAGTIYSKSKNSFFDRQMIYYNIYDTEGLLSGNGMSE